MHFTAKRGIAITCRLSVCLSVSLSVSSVTLVICNHIGWNSSKIISPLVTLGRSLFPTPTWLVCSKGNTPKLGLKVTQALLIWASETFDSTLRQNGYTAPRPQWRAYRNHRHSFEWCHRWPLRPPLPQKWVPNAPDTRMAISPQRVIRYTYGSRVGFSGSADRMALFSFTSNPSWRQAAILDNFQWPYLRNGSFDPLIQRASRGHLYDSTPILYWSGTEVKLNHQFVMGRGE